MITNFRKSKTNPIAKKEILGNISSIDTMGLVDGPGIRFVVFMQGCRLRCQYCHNPETWNISEQKKLVSPQKLVNMICRYKNYFGDDGGVTFSGGEPLLQPDFLIECLKLCKENNIHTCLDTAGVGAGKEKEILELVDLVIMDIKAVPSDLYKKITGFQIEKSLQFLDLCQKLNKKMWIRQVIVPGINDNEESVLQLKEFVKNLKNVEKIELLPYKTLGTNKYKQLGLPYRLKDVPEMDEKRCKQLEKLLLKNT